MSELVEKLLLEFKPSAERIVSIDAVRKAYDESGVETSFFNFASLLGFTSDEIHSQRKATHYRVSWQDRQYKTQEKLFKGPDSEENRKKADAFAKKLEAKDASDKYGDIRGRVTVKPV